jgi:hypothetical protein
MACCSLTLQGGHFGKVRLPATKVSPQVDKPSLRRKGGVMLRSMHTMFGYSILATDGEAGKVHDVLFDEKIWSTTYLVASVGGLLVKKKVLLPPTTLGHPDLKTKEFRVNWSRRQVSSSHKLSARVPVAAGGNPDAERRTRNPRPAQGRTGISECTEAVRAGTNQAGQESDNPHLRSARDLLRCRIEAIDGDIGRVGDLMTDDVSWEIRYVVIHTPGSLHHRKILISPLWIRSIAWPEETVKVDFTTQMLLKSL